MEVCYFYPMSFKRGFFCVINVLFFFTLLWIVNVDEAFAQLQTTSDTSKMDTIVFLNGEVKAVKVVDTVYHRIRFLPEKKKRKPKVMDVEKDRVFSIKFSDGQEKIIYFYDSALGNVFTVLEAKMFMLGEQEADKNYHNKWPFIIGFAAGTLSPVALPNAVALSPIAPAVTPLHTLIPIIKVNTKRIEKKNYLQYDTYLMGYEKVARKKNFMNSILGAGIGLAVGLGTWAVPDKSWSSIGINNSSTTGDNTWKKIARKNFIYGVWLGEVACSVGFSIRHFKKQARK